MYNFLKNNYGTASKTISIAIFFGTIGMIGAIFLTLVLTNIISNDRASNFLWSIYSILWSMITFFTGAAVFLYTLERKDKRPYKKIYFIVTIIGVILFSIAFSPVLIVGNAFIRIPDLFMKIPKVIKREKWYLLLIAISIFLTFVVGIHIRINANEVIITFIIIYLSLGLCFSVVPYFLFYTEEKKYFSNFLNHSLYILFCTSLVLTLYKYTIGINDNDNIFLVILNFTTILVAWKRVKDYAKSDNLIKEFQKKQSIDKSRY